jgi:Lon protease-like protein
LHQREQDGRLSLVVQGLARGLVLKETQALPYSRGHVQLLPDSEALLAGARISARYLRQHPLNLPAPSEAAAQRLLALSSASKELIHYFDYEAALLSIDADGTLSPLNQLNASAIASCKDAVHATLVKVRSTLPTSQVCLDRALIEPN